LNLAWGNLPNRVRRPRPSKSTTLHKSSPAGI